MTPIKLVECPRDAMQGIHDFIPTTLKAAYINLLLECGFDTIDFGSFVSPKSIPQMRDTAEVLGLLNLANSRSKLLAIVANTRGAMEAASFPEISCLGFPFSISETFQQRNTNSGIDASLHTVDDILSLCDKNRKDAVIYLSMGFGNPYGDAWGPEIVGEWAQKLVDHGVKILSVADTTGMASAKTIKNVLPVLIHAHSNIEIGVHLHSTPAERINKIAAAYESGCRRFDGALRGFGGCPMADDELTGNIATEDLIYVLEQKNEILKVDKAKFQDALAFSSQIFLNN